MRLPRHLKGRLGFTTGACATGALKGALLGLQGKRPAEVDLLLPIGRKATFKLHRLEVAHAWAQASVIKDAGDDPDVTHQAEIRVAVSLCPGRGEIIFRAGEGVGLVTKPGLGLPLQEPAITKVPRRMMEEVVRETLREELPRLKVEIVLSIPGGERLAQKTLNPRLGIVGGLSILGTKGIVIPFSTAAYKATIAKALMVAKALGLKEVVLSTGGRTEAFCHRLLPELPEEALVQMGDFVGFSLRLTRLLGFKQANLAMMIGKMAKLALGLPNTHAKHGDIPLTFLREILYKIEPKAAEAKGILEAHTARGFLEALKGEFPHLVPLFAQRLCQEALRAAQRLAQGALVLKVFLFDFDGKLLAWSAG